MGAGILPFTIYKGRVMFLFGRENKDKTEDSNKKELWSDFGGSKEGLESYFDTAVREGFEESSGFFGDKEANPEKYYKKALKKIKWDGSRVGFYEWVAVQAEYECAPNHEYFKEFQDIWTGKAENYSSKMDIDEFDKHSKFYNRLCEYIEFM